MIIVKFTIVYMVNINMFKNHWNQMLRKRGGEATDVWWRVYSTHCQFEECFHKEKSRSDLSGKVNFSRKRRVSYALDRVNPLQFIALTANSIWILYPSFYFYLIENPILSLILVGCSLVMTLYTVLYIFLQPFFGEW